MGIALFTFNTLVTPLRSLARWLMNDGRPGAGALQQKPIDAGKASTQATSGRTQFRWSPAKLDTAAPVQKPLRVVRVVEASHGPSTAGRMVISGRMADVCAELDRLAALETAHC